MDDLNTQQEVEEANRPRRLPPPPPVRKSTGRRILLIVVILLVVAALVWWIRARPAQQARTGRYSVSATMPVVAASAMTGNINIVDDALGTVTALATVTIQTQINGQLTQVGFQEGQLVHKGDFLAQIDPRPYQAALDQAQGQLLKDQASLKEAQMDLARYQKLAAQNSIAKQQAEDQVYVVGQDEGTVKLDQAQVENAQLNLAYCRIVSPVTGRIGLRQIDPGNYVQASSATGIAVITQLQPISIIFTLPEDDLPAILQQANAGAKLQAIANDRSDTIKLATGTLSAIDSQIDTTTGTVKMRAQFDNQDGALFPNQFVNIHLLVKVLQGVTTVPTSAIQRGTPATFVYMVKADDTVSVQAVTLGPEYNGNVQVVKGLSPGDKVVVDGADKLREGAKVSLRTENAAPATAATPAAPAAAGSAAPATAQPAPGQPPAPDQPPLPGQAPAQTQPPAGQTPAAQQPAAQPGQTGQPPAPPADAQPAHRGRKRQNGNGG